MFENNNELISSSTLSSKLPQNQNGIKSNIAEVTDIILDENHVLYTGPNDIGKAVINILDGNPNPEGVLATPGTKNIFVIPIIGELVKFYYILDKVYYEAPISYIGDVFENTSNKLVTGDKVTSSSTNISNFKSSGPKPTVAPSSTPTTDNKLNKLNKSKQVDMVPGMLMIQSRFGSAMIFSYDKDARYQNITITNNALNNDNSIFICEQNVEFNASTNGKQYYYNNLSEPVFKGKQIILNSDRIILNSNQNEISIFSKRSLYGSANEKIIFECGDNIILSTAKSISLKANKITIGDGATIPAVLGTKLTQLISKIIQEMTKLTFGAPGTPPVNLPSILALNSEVTGILSNNVKII
jgi:hypothetical protein